VPDSDWVMATCERGRGAGQLSLTASVSGGRRRRKGTHTTLGQRLRVGTVGEDGGGLGEGAEAGDREVLLVVALADDLVLGLRAHIARQLMKLVLARKERLGTHGEDRGEDVGLAVGVAVGADTEIDLLRARVLLERLGDTCR